MTPTEVWEGFNPTKEPLETSIISSEESGNCVRNEIFFTSETLTEGRVRVYARIIYDRRWSDARAAVLVIPSMKRTTEYEALADKLLEEGYVVCRVDYCGLSETDGRKTIFPDGLDYAAYPECLSHMDTVVTDARNTPWFQWAKIVRRAITMLQEQLLVDKDRIGVLGLNEGAQLAWQTAGIDKRVRALIPINGGGYLWLKQTSRFTSPNIPADDNQRAFSTGVGAETYAKTVHCPTCFIVSSNSSYFDADRAGDILALVPSDKKQLIINKGTDEQISQKCFDALLVWMRNNFALDGETSPNPTLTYEKIEGRYYLKLYTDIPSAERLVFCCSGETCSMARDWRLLSDEQKTGKNYYIYPVPDCEADISVAFAGVAYPDGKYVTTPIICTKNGNAPDSPCAVGVRRPRIIYASHESDSVFSPETDAVILKDDLIKIKPGPFDILGVTTEKGRLYFCRSSREMSALDRNTMLHFDAYSPDARSLTVSLTTFPDLKTYSASVKLKGGQFWQKVLLTSSDFKSAEGRTYSYTATGVKFTLSDCEGVLFNNFLWI